MSDGCVGVVIAQNRLRRLEPKVMLVLDHVQQPLGDVSIDDFGTGYSSLAYFRTLPADELKIDRSFVMNLVSSATDRHLVQSLIDLAHRFNIAVVAEGIEDEAMPPFSPRWAAT